MGLLNYVFAGFCDLKGLYLLVFGISQRKKGIWKLSVRRVAIARSMNPQPIRGLSVWLGSITVGAQSVRSL